MSKGKRIERHKAIAVAAALRERLGSSSTKIITGGSIRRGRAPVGDIDLVAVCNTRRAGAVRKLQKHPRPGQAVRRFKNYVHQRVRLHPRPSWCGVAVLHGQRRLQYQNAKHCETSGLAAESLRAV